MPGEDCSKLRVGYGVRGVRTLESGYVPGVHGHLGVVAWERKKWWN